MWNSMDGFDVKRTVVVLNLPSYVDEEEVTIHFQTAKHGGGDVAEIKFDQDGSHGIIAFVIFHAHEVAQNVINYEQVINGNRIQVQSYESWLKNKRDVPGENNKEGSHVGDAVKTIYVSGIKETTTQDAVTLFFRNKRRSCGGELCPGEEGYGRLSATIACLTFLSSKDAQNVLKRANEIPFKLEGNALKVNTAFKPNYWKHSFDKGSHMISKTVRGECSVDPLVMEYIENLHQMETKFGFKSVKYDTPNSTFYFTKGFDNPKQAEEFKTNVKAFFNSFSREEIKIPEGIFRKIKDAIENGRDKFEHVSVDFVGFRVFLVGKTVDVSIQKQEIEDMIETEVSGLIDRTKTVSYKPSNTARFRFISQHSWEKVIAMKKIYDVEFIDVSDNLIKLTGTPFGREEMIAFLDKLFRTVVFKILSVTGAGMKELTTERMSRIEKTYKCVIEKCIHPKNLEMQDGSLKLSLGSRNLTVEIVSADICNETTDVIMHVARNLSFGGGVGSALLIAGGTSIFQECAALGQPPMSSSTLYTNAGNLAVRKTAHVFTKSWKKEDLKKSLETFFDDVSKRNITSIAFSAIGTGQPAYTERESVDIIFDSLSKVAESKDSALNLIRIVIFDKRIHRKFKDAAKTYVSKTNLHFNWPSSEKPSDGVNELSIKIYSDDFTNIENACVALRKMMRCSEEED